MGGSGEAEGEGSSWLSEADVPRRGPLCPETPGPAGEGARRGLLIHYCHVNHLEVQLSINH